MGGLVAHISRGVGKCRVLVLGTPQTYERLDVKWVARSTPLPKPRNLRLSARFKRSLNGVSPSERRWVRSNNLYHPPVRNGSPFPL